MSLKVLANTGLEAWGVEHRSDLFTKVFGLKVIPTFQTIND